MGKIKYIKEIRRFLKENPVVDLNSIKKFIQKKDKRYVYLLISNLLKQGEIKKITKGYYSTYDDPSLIVFCFKPSYLGLQNALSFHNLWEQETNPIVITSCNIRTGLRKVFGKNAIVKRMNPKYMFGFEYYKYSLEDREIYLPYSDIEKTFIDLIHFKIPLDEEVIHEFRKKIDVKKLRNYLKVYPRRTKKRVIKVLGVNR